MAKIFTLVNVYDFDKFPSRQNTFKNGSLRLGNFLLDVDTGKYRCVVSNKYGGIAKEFHVEVKGISLLNYQINLKT